MPGRIFKRIVESTFPPSALDLWLRHTKCGAELLYWDENIQRWHAFHYLTFAEEVKGLEEMAERIFDEKASSMKVEIRKFIDEQLEQIKCNCNCNENTESDSNQPDTTT